MKPSSQSPRIPCRLSDSIHRQLNAYALAASAAGVGIVLASAPTADAKIVYHRTHRVISPNTVYHLELNKVGVIDFTIGNSAHVLTSGSQQNTLWVGGSHSNKVIAAYWDPFFAAFALKPGARIPGANRFYSGGAMVVQAGKGRSNRGTYTSGYWVNVEGRYLGLKFQIRGATHYGWARLDVRVSQGPPSITPTLTGYAYETVANKPIIAGKTKGPDVITVEGSLGALAAGRK